MTNSLDRICDHCKTPLLFHRDTLAGQMCDLQLAWADFKRIVREEWNAMLQRWHLDKP